jgi:hypothetical protein
MSRPSRKWIGAAVLLATLASGSASAEGRLEEERPNYLEIRGAYSDGAYRYLEYGRGFSSGLVVDFLYFGVPDQNELYAGLGYEIQPVESLTILPLLYAVAGREDGERGVTAGVFISRTTRHTDTYFFLGHFHPIRGDVPRYTFLDSLDVIWKGDSWGAGISAGLLRAANSEIAEDAAAPGDGLNPHRPPVGTVGALVPQDMAAIEGGWTWLAGPVVAKYDARGSWKMYVRGGSHTDARLVRTFAF